MKKKLEALCRIDKGELLKNIAAEYGVGTSTVSDWKKNRADIEDFCSKMVSKDCLSDRRMATKAKNDHLDEALYLWFCQERERGVPLSGPLVQEKALRLNSKMNGDASFTASQGWLGKWKARHGIRQLTVSGESLSGNKTASEDYKKKIKEIIGQEHLSPEQIYNADETGLFYKMMPGKTLASKIDDAAKGYKKNKDRITLLVCSNATGRHKLPLLLIGKSAKPRAFKNVNMESLPVIYRSQKSAWMNSKLFKDWFFENFVPNVEKHLRELGLPSKAILFLDNAPSHPAETELIKGNICVKFFPPQTTSLIQPMDQGVIENIKRLYKRQLVGKLLEDDLSENDNASSNSVIATLKSINIKTVAYMTATAWDQVSQATLIKAWKNVWPEVQENLNPPDDDSGDDLTTPAFVEMLHSVKGCENVEANDVEEWMHSESDVGHQQLTEEEIIASCAKKTDVSSDEDSPDENEDEVNNSVMSHGIAAEMYYRLLVYAEQQSDSSAAELLLLKRLRDRAAQKRCSSLKQRKIKDYFHQ